MPFELPESPLWIAAAVLAAGGVLAIAAAIVALARARPLRFLLRLLLGFLLLAVGGLAGAMILGLQGYHALTREEVAARVTVRPAGPQRFTALFRLADGRQETFELAGDEIYVDAHILKWKPMANLLGVHTVYELDRVAGRYHGIEQERSAPRTVYSVGREQPVDLFSLRRRYPFLSPLFDAQYGSATFVAVTGPAELEVRVSTTGLLVRDATPAAK